MSRFSFIFFLALSFILSINAVPVPPLVVRQAATQPTTLQTTNTQDTVAGQMITTCEITLTPITDSNGQPAVEEVTNCKVAMNGTNNAGALPSGSVAPAATTSAASQGGDPAATSAAASDGGAQSSASTDAAAAQSTGSASQAQSSSTDAGAAQSTAPGAASSSSAAASGQASASSASSSAASAAATTAAPASSPPAAISVNGASTVPVAALSSLLASASAAAATGTTTATAAATSVASAAEQNESATATPSTSAAAAFELPGSKLSVLPIGLGVFAGISVIALIVVGLVTYERTKYRKAFRQRKLAEQGGAMGYGGNMAEVRA